MKTIVFQGDSITDCYRLRDNETADSDNFLGMGYPTLVKGAIGLDHPGEYKFVNRAYSGDRILNVYARHKYDIVNHKPDFLSILIGVNDVWHEVDYNNGVDTDRFEQFYKMIIEDVRKKLPNVDIMILEPFVLSGTATKNDIHPERWEYFSTEVPKRAEIARRVAEEYGLIFVPLQEKFDEAAKYTENSDLLMDGVHPINCHLIKAVKSFNQLYDYRFNLKMNRTSANVFTH